MNNNGDDFEDDLAAYNERQKEDEGDGDIEQQAVTAIPEFNPVINNIYSGSLSKADQNLEDIELEQPQPKILSEKEEEEEEDEEGFYKDEEEEMDTPVSIQEIKPL